MLQLYVKQFINCLINSVMILRSTGINFASYTKKTMKISASGTLCKILVQLPCTDSITQYR